MIFLETIWESSWAPLGPAWQWTPTRAWWPACRTRRWRIGWRPSCGAGRKS